MFLTTVFWFTTCRYPTSHQYTEVCKAVLHTFPALRDRVVHDGAGSSQPHVSTDVDYYKAQNSTGTGFLDVCLLFCVILLLLLFHYFSLCSFLYSVNMCNCHTYYLLDWQTSLLTRRFDDKIVTASQEFLGLSLVFDFALSGIDFVVFWPH